MKDLLPAIEVGVFYPLATVVFVALFVVLVYRVYRRSSRAELDRAARLPLAEESIEER